MKKIFALFAAVWFVLQPLTALADEIVSNAPEGTPQPEPVYSAAYELSDGLTYTRHVSYADSYGSEREYILSYTPGSSTRIAFANGSYLYQTAAIRDLAAADYPDENFVAGINADFFNMSTGVPESAYIKDGELYTTDRDSFCLAERTDGSFFIDKPQIKLALTADETAIEYTVLHLNKEFSEYGLYLYNGRYSPTTHIRAANTSVILYPYSDKKTEQELIDALLYPEEETTAEKPSQPPEPTESDESTKNAENTVQSENAQDSDNTSSDQAVTTQTDTPEPSDKPDTAADTVLEEMLAQRAALEPTSEEYTAVSRKLDAYLADVTGYQKIGSAYFRLSAVSPQMGKTEKLVAAIVNPAAGNETIPENAYLLAADNASYGYILMSFVPGQTFSLTISGNQAFYDVKIAVGTGTVIVRDSEPVDDRTFSHYLSAQPRSAVGIRADGSLVLYAVDGRQASYSVGLKLYDLAKRMASLGCVYAANLDGGGSTAVNASLRGSDMAATVNSPSGKVERRVSNAIIFTDTAEKIGTPAEAYFYGDYYVTLSDTPIALGQPVLSDSNGFSAEDAASALSVYTKNTAATVTEDTFNPNGVSGVIEVFASADGGQTENVAAKVVSLDAPDELVLSADSTEIAPFETATLSVSAFYRKLHVASSNYSFTWSVTADQPQEESNAAEVPEAAEVVETPAGIVQDGILTPFADGKVLTVTASRGDVSAAVKIKVGAYPFVDMKDHWAVKEIYKLFQTGIVKGELAADGTPYYLPERPFSRYEFCVMLDRLTGIGSELPVPDFAPKTAETAADTETGDDTTAETTTEAPDETPMPTEELQQPLTKEEQFGLADASQIPEWAFASVYRLKETGLLDGILHHDESWNEIFDGAVPITRAEVIGVIGKICDAAPLDYSLESFTDLDEWQKHDDFIKNAVSAGVFSGYEDKTLRLNNRLTRAEGAAVFIRLQSHLEASETGN